MKQAAAALREAEIEFMLGGGLAAWALGGPPTDHDVDFYLRESDAEAALAAVEATGMRIERPPEEWLFKAYDGATLIDLIFRPAGGPIDDEHFGRATSMEVGAQTLLVASIDDVLVTKLLALSEQEPELSVRARAGAGVARADRLGLRPRALEWLAVRAGRSSRSSRSSESSSPTARPPRDDPARKPCRGTGTGARGDARVAGHHDPPGDRARGARDRGARRVGR